MRVAGEVCVGLDGLHNVSATLEPGRPRVGSVALDSHPDRARLVPHREPVGRRPREHPAGCRHRVGGRLPGDEQPGEELEEDLRLAVGAHRPEDEPGAARRVADQRRRERVRRAPARAVLGRMPGLQGEADAPVLEEDPQAGDDEVGAEAGRVGLGERDRRAVPVDHVQVDGAAAGGVRGQPGGVLRVDRRPPGAEPLGREEPRAVGVLVEHGGAVPTGLLRRLDQQMGPAGVVGVGREVEPSGDPRAGKREVALRIGRHRPDVVSPGRGAEGLDPVGAGRRQVVGGVLAAAEREQLATELALVEARASLGRDGGQGPGHTRSADDVALVELAVRRVVVGAGDELAHRGREQRRRREPLGCMRLRRREQPGEGQPPEPLVQGRPPVDTPGHGHRADVAPERQVPGAGAP